MFNDALLWNVPLPPPQRPRPAERIWSMSMRNGSRQIDAELVGRGENGWECLFRDGGFVYGRRFLLRAQALAEAAGVRQELERNGWTLMV